MPYTSFHLYFPEVAEKETRTLTTFQQDDVIPAGSYGLLEMYCDDPDCDCRRVFLEVYDWQRQRSLAFIAYGWESKEFYRNWFHGDNPKVIRDLQGPVLNVGSPQSKYAPAFLELVKEVVLSDPAYIERLKRHTGCSRKGLTRSIFARRAPRNALRLPSQNPRSASATNHFPRLRIPLFVDGDPPMADPYPIALDRTVEQVSNLFRHAPPFVYS